MTKTLDGTNKAELSKHRIKMSLSYSIFFISSSGNVTRLLPYKYLLTFILKHSMEIPRFLTIFNMSNFGNLLDQFKI